MQTDNLKRLIEQVLKEEIADAGFVAKLNKAMQLEPNNRFLQNLFGQYSNGNELSPKQRIAASRIFRKLKLESKQGVVKEISREESENYYNDIKRRNPALADQLERIARFAVLASKSEKKGPADVVQTMRVLFNKNQDVDPLRTGDTMGVEMFIDHIVGDDTETAGNAKRFYNNVFNALLKDRYED